ncbi:MAG: deoxyribonuclease IV [Patescibacteria group bacterium]
MLIGAHVSIAGGLDKAPENAAALGCEVFQMFTRSPRGGTAPKITPDIAATFLAEAAKYGLSEWVVHAPYYLNFASGRESIRSASTRVVREELERATAIRAKYMMFHPGSARDVGGEQALIFCINGIKSALKGYTGTTIPLIEISAGAGEIIGDTFDELRELLDGISDPRLGICLDTAHMFASGYDLRNAKSLTDTLDKLESEVGLEKIKMVHCNDSKIALGGKRDMHEHIGKGKIGIAGFRAMLAEPRLKHLNFYCETKPEGVEADVARLKKMRDSA